MVRYDVIVIGAGPAGLFAAINCATQGKRILILEKNNGAGKKLLLSGAGQCNITHAGDMKNFLSYYGENHRFLRHPLFRFTNEDILDFFKERGLEFITQESGKVFPRSLRSIDILNILLEECKKKGIEIKYNYEVEDIQYSEENRKFNVKNVNGNGLSSDFLIIATGGMSYTNTGSTGDGYVFGKNLGHSIIKPLPALTPLYIKDYPFKDLSGISFENVPITLWRGNKKFKDTRGDILFTHKSISGPGILNFSRYVLPGDKIRINFIKEDNLEGFEKEFVEKLSIRGKHMIKTILKDYDLPKRFIDKLLELANIEEKVIGAQLSKKKRNELIKMLIAFPMEVEKLGDFHLAMVTRGGIKLKEINPKTMESRIIEGLYFVGEVLDIDGDTGGYNIQAAFSTGYAAGDAISKKLN